MLAVGLSNTRSPGAGFSSAGTSRSGLPLATNSGIFAEFLEVKYAYYGEADPARREIRGGRGDQCVDQRHPAAQGGQQAGQVYLELLLVEDLVDQPVVEVGDHEAGVAGGDHLAQGSSHTSISFVFSIFAPCGTFRQFATRRTEACLRTSDQPSVPP